MLRSLWATQLAYTPLASQRSLHNAPIFRLLLKVAVNGTHQCDFLNFCGGSGPQRIIITGLLAGWPRPWLGRAPWAARRMPDAGRSCIKPCWKKLASLLPLEKFCYGWLHRRLLRRYRPQSAVNCSTLWERAAGSSPNTSQVSLKTQVKRPQLTNQTAQTWWV